MNKRKITEVLDLVNDGKRMKPSEEITKPVVDQDPWELLAESMDDCDKLEQENQRLHQQIQKLNIMLAQKCGVHCSVIIEKI